MPGPLAGIRAVEIAGPGAAPFAAMMLADMGADVLRIDRARGPAPVGAGTVLDRGRRSVPVDLKHPRGVELVLWLCERADALIEGFRPGVAERLGIGPDACLERNPRLVYGRLTGWGQDGPLASAPGHDINFVALSGALNAIGQAGGPPAIPLNLIGDFGGGGLVLAYGIACALLERERSGRGQVIDAAMVEGASLLGMIFHAYAGRGWSEERGTNHLDGGAPFYNVYECADARYVAVGAIEPQFYAALLKGLGLEEVDPAGQMDPRTWPGMRDRFAAVFRTKTRDEWCALLEGTDACLAPVLSWTESQRHRHNLARGTFGEADGVPQPRPHPRFSRTPPDGPGSLPDPARADETLASWGVSGAEIAALRREGALG